MIKNVRVVNVQFSRFLLFFFREKKIRQMAKSNMESDQKSAFVILFVQFMMQIMKKEKLTHIIRSSHWDTTGVKFTES